MAEAFPKVLSPEDADKVHELTSSYMRDIEAGVLNPLWASEDLAGQVAIDAINEDVAEAVTDNLGIDEVIDD